MLFQTRTAHPGRREPEVLEGLGAVQVLLRRNHGQEQVGAVHDRNPGEKVHLPGSPFRVGGRKQGPRKTLFQLQLPEFQDHRPKQNQHVFGHQFHRQVLPGVSRLTEVSRRFEGKAPGQLLPLL